MSIASFGAPRPRPAPRPSNSIMGIGKAHQNDGAVDQRVRGRQSTTRLPLPIKSVDRVKRRRNLLCLLLRCMSPVLMLWTAKRAAAPRCCKEIDQNQIRLVAGPDGAEATGQTGGTRVADSGMPQNLVREAGARLRLADCSDEAKHLHRLEYALHIATVQLSQPSPTPTPDWRMS